MSAITEASDQSVGLVQSLLKNRFVGNNKISIVQNDQISEERLLPGFDIKGSTRVEVLFDNVAKGGNCEVINLHGLAENCEEKQVPMVFFCEMVWFDTEMKMRVIDSTEQAPSSFVIEPVGNPSVFRNTAFSVTFENQQNGELVGRGEGYLRFERKQQQMQVFKESKCIAK